MVKLTSKQAGGKGYEQRGREIGALALIEKRRAETGDEFLGAGIERAVLDMQIQEIEADILENPGAIEPWLLRRRKID